MLTLTPTALKTISRFIKSAAEPVAGLRISAGGGGCSGIQYGMTMEPQPNPDDVVVETGSFNIYIDPTSASMLKGVEIDFVDSAAGDGFTFNNPNVPSACGSCDKKQGG